MTKVLNTDAQSFATECADTWEADAKSSGRLARPVEGPGEYLGMDKLIQCEIDRLIEADNASDGLTDAVLDRNSFSDKHLVLAYQFQSF